jgi:hypothetical protein
MTTETQIHDVFKEELSLHDSLIVSPTYKRVIERSVDEWFLECGLEPMFSDTTRRFGYGLHQFTAPTFEEFRNRSTGEDK